MKKVVFVFLIFTTIWCRSNQEEYRELMKSILQGDEKKVEEKLKLVDQSQPIKVKGKNASGEVVEVLTYPIFFAIDQIIRFIYAKESGKASVGYEISKKILESIDDIDIQNNNKDTLVSHVLKAIYSLFKDGIYSKYLCQLFQLVLKKQPNLDIEIRPNKTVKGFITALLSDKGFNDFFEDKNRKFLNLLSDISAENQKEDIGVG